MAKKKAEPKNSGPVQLWRVPIICVGTYDDYVSVVIPMWDNKAKHPNRVFLYYHKDMPAGLLEKLKVGTEFHGKVPMICHSQVEFLVKDAELP